MLKKTEPEAKKETSPELKSDVSILQSINLTLKKLLFIQESNLESAGIKVKYPESLTNKKEV